MTMTENPQLGAVKMMYSDITAQLNEVDEALDSTVDAKSAGKRALRNDLVKQYEGDWAEPVKTLIDFITSLDADKKVALFSAFVQNLNKTFEEDANKFLEEQVEANKTETPQVTYSEEQIKAMQEKRSELYKAVKNTRELAIVFGGSEDDFPMPKKRTGTRGRRGKRAISLYDWAINGEALSAENNNLAWVSETYKYESVAALRNAIRESLQLKDLKNPPSPITFVLPEGSVLSGVRDMSEETDTSTDDDESDEDDEDDDEENGE